MMQAELGALLEAGDAAGVQHFFAGRPEKERKQLAAICRAHLDGLMRKLPTPELAPMALRAGTLLLLQTWLKPADLQRFMAARLALFCSGALGDVRGLGLPDQEAGEQIVEALMERRPAWLERWAARLVQAHGVQFATNSHFRVVRRFVRAGLIEAPLGVDYVRHMLRVHDGPAQMLRDDPTLLEDAIWLLFEPNPDIQVELARNDPPVNERGWAAALAEAAADGRLSRGRLLDGILTVLESEPKLYHVRWYIAFHERLQPSAGEVAERLDRYFGLLHNKMPLIVGCALDSLAVAQAAQPLAAERLAAGVSLALEVMDAKRVQAVLKLLERAVQGDPAGAAAACLAASRALAQAKGRIQGEAWAFIERHGSAGDAALATQVEQSLALVAATLQPKLRAWLGVARPHTAAPALPAAPSADHAELRARAAALAPAWRTLARLDHALQALERGVIDFVPLADDGMALPRLDPARALAPVVDLDAMLDLLGRMVHGGVGPDDYERILDGLARLGLERPADFDARAAPLRVTVDRLLVSREAMQETRLDWYSMAIVEGLTGWLERPAGEAPRPWALRGGKPDEARPGTFDPALPHRAYHLNQRRLKELLARVRAGIAAPLLSAPTHRGGWIDPRVLVARVGEYLRRGLPFGEYDSVLALLRLAPDQRGAALAAARDLPAAADPGRAFAHEFPLALRHALGDEVLVGPTASLWIAAARSRDPRADDARVESTHPDLGPAAGCAATIRVKLAEHAGQYTNPVSYTVTPRPPAAMPYTHVSVLLHTAEVSDFLGGMHAHLFLLWPQAPETLFARAARWMADRQEGLHFNAERRLLVEPLLDPGVPLEPHATRLLAFGLTAKDAGVHGMAVDALIAAIEDGRFDPQRLGRAMREIAAVKLGKPSRWATTLESVARVGPVHAEAMRQTLEHALQGDPGRADRTIAPLVELLLELCAQVGRGVTAAATRAYLAELPSGKAATAAKRLLAVETNADSNGARAVQAALVDYRLARAERWAREFGELNTPAQDA